MLTWSKGLPKEWQRALAAAGITEEEQRSHPKTVMEVVNYVQEQNVRSDEDAMWEKSQAIGRNYLPSARFPSNGETSFENPRAAPVPPAPSRQPSSVGLGLSQTSPLLLPSKFLRKGSFVPARGAPPVAAENLDPMRQYRKEAVPAPIKSPILGASPQEYPSQRARAATVGAQSTTMASNPTIHSPQQYQQQQEQAMFAAQQTLHQKQVERGIAPRSPNIPPLISSKEAEALPPLPVSNSPKMPYDTRATPPVGGAPELRPRQRKASSRPPEDTTAIIAKLKEICSKQDPFECYKNLEQVGKGASGEVFTAIPTAAAEVYNKNWNAEGRGIVAIKKMNLEQQPKKDLIVNEILVMKEYVHKNVVNFIESYLVGGTLMVVMEYMDGGNLTDVVTFNMMSEPQIAAVCREVSISQTPPEPTLIQFRPLMAYSIYTQKGSSIEISSPITFYYLWTVISS